jgi:hypothetical protein
MENLAPPEIRGRAAAIARTIEASLTDFGSSSRVMWDGDEVRKMETWIGGERPWLPKAHIERVYWGNPYSYEVETSIDFDSGSIDWEQVRIFVSSWTGIVSWSVSPGVISRACGEGVFSEQGIIQVPSRYDGDGDTDIHECLSVLTSLERCVEEVFRTN